MTFIPTQEQLAIVDFVKTRSDNLIINAYAGAAKTSTLVLIAHAMKTTPMLCLAFNKKIATEMQERLPSLCMAKTLNALGHRAWAETINKKLKISTRKNFQLVKTEMEKFSKIEREELNNVWGDLLRAIALGKSCGYIPDNIFKKYQKENRHCVPLMSDDDFYNHLTIEPTENEWKIIRKVSAKSIELAFTGELDFDDQLLMPTCFKSEFPQFPIVLIDEAQDLSAINHCMLKKVAKKRLIAVGDKCQAIYGFRGAHEKSMQLLREGFQMYELNLTTSFRCPSAIVKNVLDHAQDMKAWEKSPIGQIIHTQSWNADFLDNNSVIICRNNAPLFKAAIRLLQTGITPELVGKDILSRLEKILISFGKEHIPQDEVYLAINAWQQKMLLKARPSGIGYINDQTACLNIFADVGENLGEALTHLKYLKNVEGKVKLMTGHKSKGLEFETVFFLDQHLLNMKDIQDRNLNYVIKTRAQKDLYFVRSDKWIE